MTPSTQRQLQDMARRGPSRRDSNKKTGKRVRKTEAVKAELGNKQISCSAKHIIHQSALLLRCGKQPDVQHRQLKNAKARICWREKVLKDTWPHLQNSPSFTASLCSNITIPSLFLSYSSRLRTEVVREARAHRYSPTSPSGGNPSCRVGIWTWSSRSQWKLSEAWTFWSGWFDQLSWPPSLGCASSACALAVCLSSRERAIAEKNISTAYCLAPCYKEEPHISCSEISSAFPLHCCHETVACSVLDLGLTRTLWAQVYPSNQAEVAQPQSGS